MTLGTNDNMTTCGRCNEPISMVSSDGGTDIGDEFIEEYRCVNGHIGALSGTVGDDFDDWLETGVVFCDD